MSELVNLKVADFACSAQHDGTIISARLTGTADYAGLEPIEEMLAVIHAKAQELGVREVVIDVRVLEFMNSSCFKKFVRWISEIKDLDASRWYQIRFLSDPSMHWQKRSLRTLACFATDLITVA